MSVPYKQNSVSAAIWSWQTTEAKMKQAKPSLLVSLGALLIGCTVAFFLFFFDHLIMAGVVSAVSALVFIASRFFPAVYAVIEKIFQKLSNFVGTGLTWILLLPFFYICFPLGRIVQKIKGKDPMQRHLDPDVVSYWQTCKEVSSVDEYKRQF